MSILELLNLAPTFLWLILIGMLVVLCRFFTATSTYKFDAWAGDLSYSVYLMHIPALYFVVNQLDTNGHAQLWSFVLVTFLLAWINEKLYSRGFDRVRDVIREATLRSYS